MNAYVPPWVTANNPAQHAGDIGRGLMRALDFVTDAKAQKKAEGLAARKLKDSEDAMSLHARYLTSKLAQDEETKKAAQDLRKSQDEFNRIYKSGLEENRKTQRDNDARRIKDAEDAAKEKAKAAGDKMASTGKFIRRSAELNDPLAAFAENPEADQRVLTASLTAKEKTDAAKARNEAASNWKNDPGYKSLLKTLQSQKEALTKTGVDKDAVTRQALSTQQAIQEFEKSHTAPPPSASKSLRAPAVDGIDQVQTDAPPDSSVNLSPGASLNAPNVPQGTTNGSYKIGGTYAGGLIYLGGDPNDETSWKKAGE